MTIQLKLFHYSSLSAVVCGDRRTDKGNYIMLGDSDYTRKCRVNKNRTRYGGVIM